MSLKSANTLFNKPSSQLWDAIDHFVNFVGFCWFLLAILLVFVGRKDFRVLLSRDIFLTHIDLQNAQPTTYYLLAFAHRIRAELFGLGPNAPRRWQLTSAN